MFAALLRQQLHANWCAVQEAFIDVCYINNLGIGVHPQRRTEMVKAKASAKGHSHS